MFVSSPYDNRAERQVIAIQYGDVTGDGAVDAVYMTGKNPYGPDSPFFTSVELSVQDGRSGAWTTVTPGEQAGYGPAIFLGDFTENGIEDVMFSLFSGGSGEYTFYYIYSFAQSTPVVLFDFERFNQETTYTVTYQDQYRVLVSASNGRAYTIDLTYKGPDYLGEIYNEDGTLKEPIEGWVNPLGGLYPVDFQRNAIYGLYATQRIAGRYNADAIGYVQTSLSWKNGRFEPFLQTVGIFG